MKQKVNLFCFCLLLCIIAVPCSQAQSTNDLLNQYVLDLQKSPNDNALREKIIKHVQTMEPLPQIPEEARRHYVMAKTLFKDAKSENDYSAAIDEFKSALLVAPWWPGGKPRPWHCIESS